MEPLQNELQSEQSKWLVNTWSNWVLMGAVVHTLPRPLCSCKTGLSFTDLIAGTWFEKLRKRVGNSWFRAQVRREAGQEYSSLGKLFYNISFLWVPSGKLPAVGIGREEKQF